MTLHFHAASAVTIAVSLVILSPAEASPTVDELITKNIKARGGLDKIKAIKSLRMEGKLIQGQGFETPWKIELKRENRMRLEFTFQGMTGIQAYDGKNGWQLMPFRGRKTPEPMSPDEVKAVAEQADMLEGPLIDYRKKGHKVELIGQENVEGTPAFKLKVSLKNGDIRYIYLDAEYFITIKEEGKRKIRGTEIETETSYGDFKPIAGVMFPHTFASGPKGKPKMRRFVVESAETNISIADSHFTMPKVSAESKPKTKAKSPSKGK